MCTIALTFNENKPEVVCAMAKAVQHRGPNSFELWYNERHGVAACRLSIFGDLQAPMIFNCQKSGRIVLLNGEIYNYKNLWKDLAEHGCYPETDLETELILALYDLYKLDFAAKLKGMFAIAILDGDQLILARDRFGIKPLYYTIKDKRVLVCSEIKGILNHPSLSPILNKEALQETQVFGYVYSQDETFFQGIKQVSPGSVISFDASGSSSERRFSSFPKALYLNGSHEMDYSAAVCETKKRVIGAAERMFQHGNMEKGLYLSGGIDSSIIAYVARCELGYPVQSFTLADDPDTPDLLSARKVADTLKTEHRECFVSIDEYWRWLPDYLAHYESLMAGGVFHIQGGLAFHLLSKYVAQHVKVAFSGEGADELFGGYYWIYTHPLGFSDRIKAHVSNLKDNERIRILVDSLFPQPEDEMIYRKNLFDHLLLGGLSNYHLQSVDRSAGAFGFEIRPLYLDDDLSQWAMELPIDYKVPDKNTTKNILRHAFQRDFQKLGLDGVTNRLKMGMPSAIAKLDKHISLMVDKAISDEEVQRHPLGKILVSKMSLLMFDLFEHIFFRSWDHHSESVPPDSLLARLWPA